MTTLKPSYGTPVALACTTTALASDANLLAGRQSVVADNTADLAVDAILGGTIVTGAGVLVANTAVELWLFGSWDNGTLYTAGAGAGDAALSPAALGIKNMMALAAVLQQPDATGRTYTIGPISVAQAFGGTMPDHWGFYIVHNTGQNLGATALKYTPVQYTSV